MSSKKREVHGLPSNQNLPGPPDFAKSAEEVQDQNHLRRLAGDLLSGVTLIRSALVANHLPKSGVLASSCRACSVDSFVKASHSASEYLLLSGVVWKVEGYESDSFEGGDMGEPVEIQN